MTKETPMELPPLTIEEQKIVDNLTLNDIENIDKELLMNSTNYRQKIAILIAYTMSKLKQHYSNVPIAFYLERIIKLVDDEKLKVSGNIKFIRFSEVTLTGK